MKFINKTLMIFLIFSLYACDNRKDSVMNSTKQKDIKLSIEINSYQFKAAILDNDTVKVFLNLLPLSMQMNELNNNENIIIYQLIYLHLLVR